MADCALSGQPSKEYFTVVDANFSNVSREVLMSVPYSLEQQSSSVGTFVTIPIPSKLQSDLLAFHCRRLGVEILSQDRLLQQGGLIVSDSRRKLNRFEKCHISQSPNSHNYELPCGAVDYIACAVGCFSNHVVVPVSSKFSMSCCVWVYNCSTNRWRCTHLDTTEYIDEKSMYELVESPSTITIDHSTQRQSQPSEQKQHIDTTHLYFGINPVQYLPKEGQRAISGALRLVSALSW